MACGGNALFRGRGCPYPSFLSQVTKGHPARLPLRGARGGRHARGRSAEAPPWTVGPRPGPGGGAQAGTRGSVDSC